MLNKKQSIGLFGIGAIGSLMANELHSNDSNNELFYFNRSPKSIIRHKRGKKNTEIPIKLGLAKENSIALDWLLVCIKEHHFSAAATSLSYLINSNTKVVVIRNGLNLKDPYLAFTEESKILETVIDCSVQCSQDGFFQSYSPPIISVPPGALSEDFKTLFQHSETVIQSVNDFKTISWKKLCESSALGAVLCLTGESSKVFQANKYQQLYLDILAEGIKVAEADGAIFETDFRQKSLKKVLAYPPEKGTSMLSDKLMGRPIEWGAKNAAICAVGLDYSIPTPINKRIVRHLQNENKKT